MKPACFLMSVVALPLGWVGCDSDRGTGVVETGFACPVTDAIWAEPPRDPNADPFGKGPWYINADRTIWAGWDADRMVACPEGNKVLWIRPQGTQLTVSGRRLDANAGPASATIPCCYPTGFQASGLMFHRGLLGDLGQGRYERVDVRHARRTCTTPSLTAPRGEGA